VVPGQSNFQSAGARVNGRYTPRIFHASDNLCATGRHRDCDSLRLRHVRAENVESTTAGKCNSGPRDAILMMRQLYDAADGTLQQRQNTAREVCFPGVFAVIGG